MYVHLQRFQPETLVCAALAAELRIPCGVVIVRHAILRRNIDTTVGQAYLVQKYFN
jgi:hypothetical protein